MTWYTKVSREEADKPREFPLIEPGVYRFQVNKASLRTSKNGNPMMAVEISVWDDSRTYNIFDYLVNIPSMTWKIRHFADSLNLGKEYDNDTLEPEMCVGLYGMADINIQPAKDGYAAKNIVVDYVLNEQGQVKSEVIPNATKPVEFNDLEDLPF